MARRLQDEFPGLPYMTALQLLERSEAEATAKKLTDNRPFFEILMDEARKKVDPTKLWELEDA